LTKKKEIAKLHRLRGVSRAADGPNSNRHPREIEVFEEVLGDKNERGEVWLCNCQRLSGGILSEKPKVIKKGRRKGRARKGIVLPHDWKGVKSLT